MNRKKIEEKWTLVLDAEPSRGFRSLILDPRCKAEIFLGINQKAERSLMLRLPDEFSPYIRPVKKEKISIDYMADSRFLILALHDSQFNDLFDDLVLSFYNSITNIPDPEGHTNEFLKIFSKWVQLFEDQVGNRLSSSEVQGLYGELCFLKSRILEKSEIHIDHHLESWVGPYDRGHDFITESCNFEIKTKSADSQTVTISSEVQLEPELGKDHHLVVYSVLFDLENGGSLSSILLDIRGLIESKLGDVSILRKALQKKSLTFENVRDYDNYRFRVKSVSIYDARRNEFPSIIKSNIPENVSKVNYKLNLYGLDNFVVERRDL
ncbi:PD-(D/E)XK motif protein [Microbulbifer aggregans]|uniref:PD-(D/E)XK motif protein n=1 Tax=Microbulbifer aggregans TaxID=1769779 RepID=UPI001CFD2354|nr:PD-(D/E)XK motif protein [Microbulbifer aggregans]